MSKLSEYPMTDKTFRCGHCGNTTVMQKIAVNRYTQTIDKDIPEQCHVDYEWYVLVCCTCKEVNVIEYSIWPDQEKNINILMTMDVISMK